MIYGMGTKALGDTLVVDETEASLFMDSFKSKYPGKYFNLLRSQRTEMKTPN